MALISLPTALLGGAALSAGSSIFSGILGSNASKQASQQQAMLGMLQLQAQLQQRAQTQQNLAPFLTAGGNASQQLAALTGTNAGGNPLTAALTAPFQPTMAQLAQTPGYQFNLDQGTKAVQNSYAAQGLGQSGAALKGAAGYASGLADTTYQHQFQNYLAQNAQIAQMLAGQTSLGENAAVQQGNQGNFLTGLMTNSLGGIGQALASGTVGSANAIANAGTGFANAGANGLVGYALGNSGIYGNSSGTGAYAGFPGSDLSQPGPGFGQQVDLGNGQFGPFPGY